MNGHDFGPETIRVSAAGAPADRIAKRIADLKLLQPNWDSYGALPVRHAALVEAEKVLRSEGNLVPCSDGGVQIDWPNAEITFRPDGSQEFDDVAHAAFKGLAMRHAFVLGKEIAEERERQDAQWGPDHDDRHDRADWLGDEMIGRFSRRALMFAHVNDPQGMDSYEQNMIKIAAMAIAAVKASRRNRAPHGCIDIRPMR